MLCFRFQTVKMDRLGGKFLIAFFPQFIALSLANQNLVPIFISEMGKLNSAFIGIPSPLGSISAALLVLPTRGLISQTAAGNRTYIAKSHWYQIRIHIRPGLLEAWLVLTSVKYHGNLYILIPLNQRLALTRLRAIGPSILSLFRRYIISEFSYRHTTAKYS